MRRDIKNNKKIKKDIDSDDDDVSSADSGEDHGLEELEMMATESSDDDNIHDSNDENIQEDDDDDDEEEESESDYDEDEDSSDDIQEENDNPNSNNNIIQQDQDIIMQGDEKCTFDLKNLLAINSHQVDPKKLYSKGKNNNNDGENENITISPSTSAIYSSFQAPNEEFLLEKASEGCTQLLSALWTLNTEKTDAGPLASLPTYYEIVTPRSLPPPPPKVESKWDKFAKERGISPKEKRSRKVWDEATQSWAYRTGYQKPDDPQNWPIMEVKKNDDPYADPWQALRDSKKERVEKNLENRMRNQERAGMIPKGTATRTIKAKQQARDSGRKRGQLDMTNFQSPPAGIPIDLNDKAVKRGMNRTKTALYASQISTASMGKFDKVLQDEPERKKLSSTAAMKKRKFQSSTDPKVVQSESQKSMKILDNVLNGGGKAKEKAIRRGEFSKGETGHDYDFDDGLGPSNFKKRKGRAGMGKMKKVTKKRAK
jgi:regulator of ribosome biosynthesis